MPFQRGGEALDAREERSGMIPVQRGTKRWTQKKNTRKWFRQSREEAAWAVVCTDASCWCGCCEQPRNRQVLPHRGSRHDC